jgi:hypothetical protein
MDYLGEWGGGGPGHSWALKWHERSEIYYTGAHKNHRSINSYYRPVTCNYIAAEKQSIVLIVSVFQIKSKQIQKYEKVVSR